MPRRASEAASARAAYRLGSGSATLSTRVFLPSANVPSARMLQPPPVRKKLSPIVEADSAGTVRARFSNVISPRSGVQAITGGASTAAPGSMRKSTLLSWKPSADTGVAYHRSEEHTSELQSRLHLVCRLLLEKKKKKIKKIKTQMYTRLLGTTLV